MLKNEADQRWTGAHQEAFMAPFLWPGRKGSSRSLKGSLQRFKERLTCCDQLDSVNRIQGK